MDHDPVNEWNFSLGQILATPAALEILEKDDHKPSEYLERHASCDWGDVCDEDKKLNDDAVRDGARLLSAYHTRSKTKIWIITEAVDDFGNRSATTILLPEEY